MGKTTLLKQILEGREYLFLNGDDPTVRRLLTDPNTEQLKGNPFRALIILFLWHTANACLQQALISAEFE
ncbi:hypothetical protein LS482_08295 [Sinomicrobium kalidii]|uniref:hypothetical protein n=1 Tax=Sinomicrobium kalidii TaxID=2900738 RepID=UPI001E38CB65|nr:hypothetical protein [Sinomicrobium kalidii]UGU17867.1 hypothetical protein LS482_08295 [Sinomicrobium kalidii]